MHLPTLNFSFFSIETFGLSLLISGFLEISHWMIGSVPKTLSFPGHKSERYMLLLVMSSMKESRIDLGDQCLDRPLIAASGIESIRRRCLVKFARWRHRSTAVLVNKMFICQLSTSARSSANVPKVGGR